MATEEGGYYDTYGASYTCSGSRNYDHHDNGCSARNGVVGMFRHVCLKKPLNICKVFIVFIYIVMFSWSFNYNILLILIFMIDISFHDNSLLTIITTMIIYNPLSSVWIPHRPLLLPTSLLALFLQVGF